MSDLVIRQRDGWIEIPIPAPVPWSHHLLESTGSHSNACQALHRDVPIWFSPADTEDSYCGPIEFEAIVEGGTLIYIVRLWYRAPVPLDVYVED